MFTRREIKEEVEAKHDQDWFVSQVRKRLKNKRNFIAVIHGPVGSGKSYLAMKIAEVLDPTFDISRVIFDPTDFFDLVETLPKGAFLVFDESGAILDARRYMTTVNCVVSYVLETFRLRQISVIFTVPSLKMLDINVRRVMHAMIFQRDWGRARIYRMGTGFDGAIYAYRIGKFENVKKPSQKLIDAYEPKKAKAFKKILNMAKAAIGASGSEEVEFTEEDTGTMDSMIRKLPKKTEKIA